MYARRAAASWVLIAVASVLLAACGDDVGSTTQRPDPAPSLGGPPPTRAEPPSGPMDHLEKPIAERLAVQVRDEGLTLQHVECPRWSGSLPASFVCDGYVDGVLGEVQVELARAPDGTVRYDAWLAEGVVAVQRLVERLEAEGYTDVDCGDTPAYRAQVGLRLVCRVTEKGVSSHVVATVTDHSGSVRITDY